MKLSKYIVTSSYNDKVLLFSTLSRTIIALPIKYKEYIEKKADLTLIFNESETSYLVKHNFLVDKNQNETEEVLKGFKEYQKKQDSDVYELQITPSANCQLGCDYCGQKHTKQKIEPFNEAKILSHIEKRINTLGSKYLSVQWYGAEPLTAMTSIRSISSKISEFCKQNSVTYMSNIITNGVLLTEPVFFELTAMNVTRFQITIDGNKNEHDKRRFLKNGGGSFDRIFSNLLSICKSTFLTQMFIL